MLHSEGWPLFPGSKLALFVGARESNLGDLLARYHCGWQVQHGDVAATVALLRRLAEARPAALARIGERGRRAVVAEFSQAALCGRFVDLVVGGEGEVAEAATGGNSLASPALEEVIDP